MVYLAVLMLMRQGGSRVMKKIKAKLVLNLALTRQEYAYYKLFMEKEEDKND